MRGLPVNAAPAVVAPAEALHVGNVRTVHLIAVALRPGIGRQRAGPPACGRNVGARIQIGWHNITGSLRLLRCKSVPRAAGADGAVGAVGRDRSAHRVFYP